MKQWVGSEVKKISLFFTVFFLLYSPVLLFSDNIRVFKEHCMTCHGKSVPMVRPVDKARIQWERFFRRDVHMPKLQLDANERKNILTFLYDHAADSDQPMVPGL